MLQNREDAIVWLSVPEHESSQMTSQSERKINIEQYITDVSKILKTIRKLEGFAGIGAPLSSIVSMPAPPPSGGRCSVRGGNLPNDRRDRVVARGESGRFGQGRAGPPGGGRFHHAV